MQSKIEWFTWDKRLSAVWDTLKMATQSKHKNEPSLVKIYSQLKQETLIRFIQACK